MFSPIRVLILWVCFLSSACPSFSQTAGDKRAKELESEKSRLTRLTNPEARAESLTKIATITLTFANDAIATNNFPGLTSRVDEYRQALTAARDAMMESGFDAYKKPKGYQAIELATRSHLRILEDFSRRLSLPERKALDDVIDLVSRIREEILRVLFS
jgi:hypothetical protein